MYGETLLEQSAAGLVIEIFCPNIYVTLNNVTAKGNNGGLGGNIAIFLIISKANSSSTVINNSRIIDGHALKGGGLVFISRQSHMHDTMKYPTIIENHSFDLGILTICDTIFHNNSAIISGGAMYMAHHSYDTTISYLKHITITNCIFAENGGKGSSIDILQVSLQPMTPFLNTSLVMCNFTNNQLVSDDGAILKIFSDKVSIINCTFANNNSTAISLSSAYLNLYGNILFENNTARLGGAMKINEASLIFVYDGTHVRFVNNRAEEKGGAIYAKTSCVDSSVSTAVCFLQPAPPYDMPVISEFTRWMKLEFVNNSAKVSGDALYGGDFDRCSTTLPYYLNKTYHRYSYFVEIFKRVFHMKQQYRPSAISSDSRKVCFCNHNTGNLESCTAIQDQIMVYPGQNFTVSVITMGQMNSSSRGRVNASLLDEVYPSHRLIRVSYPTLSDKCIDTTYILMSNRNHAQVSFAPETAGLYCNITTAALTIHLLPCPIGFQLSHTAPYRCSCDPFLSKFLILNLQITCSIINQTISVPQKAIWFGCLNTQHQNQSSLNCDSLIVTPHCGHYCRNTQSNSTTLRIPLSDLDVQCSDGHTGIMCGTCNQGTVESLVT